MEDSSGHMETDVSSTTEDVVEVPSGSEAHRDMETSISVEPIKEEGASPNKNAEKLLDKQSGIPDAAITPPTPKLVQLKRIIIKADNKTYHIKKPAIITTTKPEQIQNILKKDSSPPTIAKQSKDVVDSSSKAGPYKSPEKSTTSDGSPKGPAIDIQLSVEKLPTPETFAQNTELNEESSKKSPLKENAQLPISDKEKPSQGTKEQPGSDVDAASSKETEPVSEESKKDLPEKPLAPTTSTPTKVSNTNLIVGKEQIQKQTPKNQTKIVIVRKNASMSLPSVPLTDKVNEKIAEKTDDSTVTSITPVSSVTSITPVSTVTSITPVPEDKEASNDSQMETNSESSEKDANKSISRELRSLIKSAKESKIISECNQLTSKTRKSRTMVDSNTSLNTSDADKIQGVRRASALSQASNCSEKSDKTPKSCSEKSDKTPKSCTEKSDKAPKRATRSQNLEFVCKMKSFMSSPSGKGDTDDETESKSKVGNAEFAASTPKKKKENEHNSEAVKKCRSDTYCWRCHWLVEPVDNEKVPAPLQCTVCPRSFHYKCLSVQERSKIHTNKSWVCPECLLVLQAENSDTRSPAMKKTSLGMLCELLKHALERMKEVNGVEPFLQPVDRTAFPDYDTYVVHPMDLSLMEAHIKEGYYGSTEAFLTDAHWILHNSIIFNTLQSKLTGGARALVRSCRAEMGEIEACPECYAGAHARRPTWFTDVCSTPHVLLWAKLKGFPYWPAKGMTVNGAGMVDVRFFGQHDRAWVPARDCFLYSEKDPNNFRTKRQDLLDSMQEAEQHIHKISRKFGKFVYPPFKTPFDPAKLNEQIKIMIPSFEGEVRSHVKEKRTYSPSTPKDKSRSDSKSSKESHHEGDASETEDAGKGPSNKIAESTEVPTAADDQSDKNKSMEIDITPIKPMETRKRRHSVLEEAVVTVLDTSKDKKKRVETTDKAAESQSTTNTEASAKITAEKEPPKQVAPKNDDEPTPGTSDKDKKSGNKQATIRVISIGKILNTAIQPKDTPKPKSDKTPNDKVTPQDEKPKAKRRRLSRSNKSLNSINKSLNSSNTIKSDKQTESVAKDTPKDGKTAADKNTDSDKKVMTYEKKTGKARIAFDEDVSLAELAKKTANDRLPTISNVKSLSSTAASTETTQTKTTTAAKSANVTVVTSSESNTNNAKNTKEVADKQKKSSNETNPSMVGRVGVRAFARMTSPPKEAPPTDVQIEIKAEPIDFDDADRQMEKMDLMNAITLRPVNPPSNNSLREVRINKVVAAPPSRKPSKPVEIRPKAKKTFPQPKKADEGRSELTSKNSMVYIPIQPPMTQAPVRGQRAPNGPVSTPPQPARSHAAALTTTSASPAVNTVTTPLVGVSMPSLSSPTVTPSNTVAVPTVGNAVHTVPLITSVNGQWTFSLQPMMSVGGVDSTQTPPLVNGVPERALQVSGGGGSPSVLLPIAPAPAIARQGNDPPREPPRLQQRPGAPHALDPQPAPPPSSAGPLSAKLNQHAAKLADLFRTLLEDSLEKLDDPAAQLAAARAQLEQARWRHQQEVDEIKHNHELTVAEMRASFDKEKARLAAESRRVAQAELDAAVKLAKSKQWCAKCSQEAQFYCCWNTSYCDYPCQRAHWAQHYAVCAQQRAQDNSDGNGGAIENRLQAAPNHLPKTTAAPNLTVGGKLAPSRVYTQEVAPKNSIIMSMVEEGGTQTMKCVGTYKQSAPNAIAPLIINKQILNSEDAAKKVVTSGGYLIVGAANAPNAPTSAGSVVTPGRRVQYFS